MQKMMHCGLFLLVLALGFLRAEETEGAVKNDTYSCEIDQTTQPFRLYIPQGYNAASGKLPCVLYLHGFDSRYDSTSVTTAMSSFADTNKWLLCFADGRGSVNYDHLGETDVLRVRAELIARYKADPDRVYLQGMSMGGHGTYRMGVRFPDLFAAASPQAGWTDLYEFYPHWYEQATSPRLAAYLDPTRGPLLRHAAALPQAENGLLLAWRPYYGLSDSTNPPLNATAMINAWSSLGHTDVTPVSHPGGHTAEANHLAYPFFLGKAVNHNRANVTYTTQRLRHDGAYWVRIEDFTVREQNARVQATVQPDGTIFVNTQNAERFVLSPPAALTANVPAVTVDGVVVPTQPWSGAVTLRVKRDLQGFPNGWEIAPGAPEAGKKRKGCEGPLDEVTLSRPFVVLYGASGTAQQTADNLRDAQLFCGQWNSRMILRWQSNTPVPDNWFVPPYPAHFATGGGVNAAEALTPLSDTAAAALNLAGKHLILFGDPSSHTLIEALRASGKAPIGMSSDGLSVTLGARNYTEAATPGLRWTFVCPRHDDTQGLAMVSKGFLSSLPELNLTAFDLGKDHEQLPWLLPDYVIWDLNRLPTGISNQSSTYRYLPERYLEAGFFTSSWALDAAAPKIRATFDGPPDPNDPGAYLVQGQVRIEAADDIGASGVGLVEYSSNGGTNWNVYNGPFVHNALGTTTFHFRATDLGLSWLYHPHPTTGFVRATQALTNTSGIGSVTIKLNPNSTPQIQSGPTAHPNPTLLVP